MGKAWTTSNNVDYFAFRPVTLGLLRKSYPACLALLFGGRARLLRMVGFFGHDVGFGRGGFRVVDPNEMPVPPILSSALHLDS